MEFYKKFVRNVLTYQELCYIVGTVTRILLTKEGERMAKESGYKYEQIISNVKRLISERGLKQGFVAEKAGFTDQEFSNIMNFRMLLRAEYVPDIAKAIGVTPNDLFALSA